MMKIKLKFQANRAKVGQFYKIYNNCVSLVAGDLKFYKYATWMYIQPNQCTKISDQNRCMASKKLNKTQMEFTCNAIVSIGDKRGTPIIKGD